MATNLDGQLVVAISSRALFDFEEENRVFEEGLAQQADGSKHDAAYMQLQLDRLDVPAKPGVAFSLVKKLLAFNDVPETPGEAQASGKQRVEVVILSRNDPVSGLRVMRSAAHYALPIIRCTFTRGESPWRYLKPLNANLFLSTHLSDVRSALDAGRFDQPTFTERNDEIGEVQRSLNALFDSLAQALSGANQAVNAVACTPKQAMTKTSPSPR